MAIIKKYKVQVISVSNLIDNNYTVVFKSLDKPFKYLPGQFLHLALDEYDPSQGWPESRCFSIQSAVKGKELAISFAIKGKYTKRMANEVIPGKILFLKLPYGDLFQKEHNKNNTVFIAGGTGITPFLSLLLNPEFKNYNNPKLYFGIRNINYNLYQQYFEEAIENNPSLKVLIFPEDQVGALNIKNIFLENGLCSTYFISGPPLMISSFKEFLLQSNVPEKHILTDDWQ